MKLHEAPTNTGAHPSLLGSNAATRRSMKHRIKWLVPSWVRSLSRPPRRMVQRSGDRAKRILRGPWGWFCNLFREWTHSWVFLFCVLYVRYLWFVYIRRQLRTLDGSSDVRDNTVKHNLRGVRPALTSERSLLLIRPLSVLEILGPPSKLRVLCVGPRSEGELFRLWSHGYELGNIRGLDLISYSPYVDLGDMHDMPYPDNSFDIVLCGWTLTYSANRPRAASEMVRVLRPGGVLAAGAQASERWTKEELLKALGYVVGREEKVSSVKQLLAWFGPCVDHIYFNHDIVKGVNSDSGNMMVVFSIKKPDGATA